MPTQTQLEDDVQSRIALDPRIPDPVEIAVSGDNGIVTLRGTVESFAQRRAAVEDAEATEGVYAVEDELDVDLVGEYRREDDEIRGVALQLLEWAQLAPFVVGYERTWGERGRRGQTCPGEAAYLWVTAPPRGSSHGWRHRHAIPDGAGVRHASGWDAAVRPSI